MTRHAAGNEDLLALVSLTCVQPGISAERSIAAIEAVGSAAARSVIARQRCRKLAMSRLAEHAGGSAAARDCAELLRPGAERRAKMQADLPRNISGLERLAADLGLEVFAFKGLGARVTYPDPAIRDLNDLDLFVRTRSDASRLGNYLHNDLGYSYNEKELPWIKYDPDSGLIYGQFNLVAPEGSGNLNIDIHFGDYSVRHCGRLGLASALSQNGPGLHVMAPEENLACSINNAAGDYFITAKDINDLIMALSLPSFDTARFARLIAGARLGPFFGYMVALLRGVSVLTSGQEARLRQLPASGRTLEPRPPLGEPDWRRRCLGTTVHAFAVSTTLGLPRALRVAANGYAYYRRPLSLRPHPAMGDKELAFNPWTCIRLVPLDLARTITGSSAARARDGSPAAVTGRRAFDADPGIELVQTRAGAFLVVEGEAFLPTVSYRVPVPLTDAAWQASRRSA